VEPRGLLERDLVLHLVTLRRDGTPRITPLWFFWDGAVLRMTSVAGKPHLRDLARDARCAVVIHDEVDPAPDGEPRYARVRARGRAELSRDEGGAWTRKITLRYVSGLAGERLAERRARDERVLVTLRPDRVSATASRPRHP
jgi:PPOX class probable F420-dependent enzyme